MNKLSLVLALILLVVISISLSQYNAKKGKVQVQGTVTGEPGVIIGGLVIDTCGNGALTISSDGKFAINLESGKTFCLNFPDVAVEKILAKDHSAEGTIQGYNCQIAGRLATKKDRDCEQLNDLEGDNHFNFVISK